MEIGEAVASLFGLGEPKAEDPTKPKVTLAKWARTWVAPIQNSQWPPATPPTDAVPVWSRVGLQIYTQNVPDGASATITVHHCHTGALVKDGKLDGLKVQGNRVVDTHGHAPEFSFEAKHLPWDPWDKPFFFFKVQISHQGLKAETQSDYDDEPWNVLRVLYQHVCVSDAVADTPAGGGLTTAAEMNEIAGILRMPDHRVMTRPFNQANVPVALWGSVLRNSYTYHHASHGDVRDRATGVQLNVPDNPPTAPPGTGPWRSVVVLGSTNLGDVEVKQAGNVPSVPRYLVYMDTCVAGWEPSLGQAFINRGTQNYIAFRMYIPDGDARLMARRFYKKWAQTYQCNPARIPNVFWDVGAPFYGSMRPVLMGYGGGQIHDSAARNAINKAITGFVANF